MNREHGNYTENSSLIDLLLTVKSNIFRTMCTSNVCIVREDLGNGSYRCEYIDDNNTFVVAIKCKDVDVQVDDAVLITFTDRDYRASLNAYKNKQQNTNTKTLSYHDKLYGIITGVVARRAEQ